MDEGAGAKAFSPFNKHRDPALYAREFYEYQSGILQGILLCMSGRQPYGSGPETLHFPAGSKPGSASAGKRGGNKIIFPYFQRVLLTREGELLYHYVKGGVEQLLEGGRMLKRMLDMDMGEVRIGASDMTLQFFYFLIWSSSTKNIRRSR